MRTWLAATLLCHVAAEQVQVHIVCRTHDDVGWLKTVDEYYTGQNNSIQHAYVHMILDTVVRALAADKSRTFTYVEQAFFVRWWRQQDEKTKALVKDLVKDGRLEFTNGGWCMHDEAAPHYVDMIDQTTLGHKFLMEEFGVAPRTGWQLDPFGHSATQASLLSAEVGFQGLFFGRIDYQDLELRQQQRSAEFVWRASKSLGATSQVFTGLTGEYQGNYGPPGGFDWDVRNSDETIQDDPALEDYNVKSRVEDFVQAALTEANMTRGKNIMMTMGSDFQYEDAASWYFNPDRLIQHVNADGRVKVFYSTPSRYVDAKRLETKVMWPLKEDDFFPYADGPHKFWTGYFTSRPSLKRYIRDSSAFFQASKQVGALAQLTGNAKLGPGVEKLAEAMGVAQHHDAVSGTAKQHVTFDYAKRLSRGRNSAMTEVAGALQSMMEVKAQQDFTVCELRNISSCAATESVGRSSKRTCFALWNGLAREREALPVFTGLPFMQITRGPLADEVVQTVGSWVMQRMRLGKKAKHVEITYTVGEIPVDDGVGKEIVSRISTDIKTAGTCYTDSNGREMIYRKRDYRASWNFTQTEPVAGNYYPVTTSLFIRDDQAQLTVLTDTSQAGTGCVRDGEIEMMVHRRLLQDDGRGVREPLNETEYVTSYVANPKGQHYGNGLVVRGQHWLHLGPPQSAAQSWRPLMDRMYMPLLPFFTKGAVDMGMFWFLKALPKNLEIVSLASWDDKTLLLRIGHQFGVDEDSELSKPATVDLQTLFAGAHITSIQERGLGGTISSDEVEKRRITWPLEAGGNAATAEANRPHDGHHGATATTVTLGPLQIRTFLLEMEAGARAPIVI